MHVDNPRSIQKHLFRTLTWLASAGSLLAIGCGGGAAQGPQTATAAPAAASPAVDSKTKANLGPEMKACPDGKIDDVEDNDGQVAKVKQRGGWWYTFTDKTGTTVTPADKFTMTNPGADGSKYAAHMSGKLSKGGIVYAGMGFNFTDPKKPYDISSYKGISFKARIGKGTAKEVRVSIDDINSDPVGKLCKDCYNAFGMDLTLTEDWIKYTIPFADMKQEKGWGDPRPEKLEVTKAYNVQFKVNHSGADFDVWVDDLEFACQ